MTELDDVHARALADQTDVQPLIERAAALRDQAHGARISYSRKVFIPLTHLCRDVCHYCTFARRPRAGESAYLSAEQVLQIARAGERAGCTEALFTLGDKPELRYAQARDELAQLGHRTTLSYLAEVSALVLRETRLLPHLNPGVMTGEEIAQLRKVSASQGIMLESASARLCEKGQVHYGSPDKHPSLRLDTIRLAGELQVPFTTGILIGIGETRIERIDALLAIRELHRRYGHVQEIIVQNFRAKPGTKLAGAREPDLHDLMWTIAVARLIFGAQMNIQAPPNLTPEQYPRLIAAGINDWGGVSPVTIDHVNPEAPWPALQALARNTEACGKQLVARLPAYPEYCLTPNQWFEPGLVSRVHDSSDADGFARDCAWAAGSAAPTPRDHGMPAAAVAVTSGAHAELERILDRAGAGQALSEAQLVRLFEARGAEVDRVCNAADQLRRDAVGDVVRYVVNRNINYTNVCYFKCKFCAFSKGKHSENLRGAPYDLARDEIARRVAEAWQRGATEVCMQGGIHPDYTGATYLDLCATVKAQASAMHIHAFSALEVAQGAQTLGLSVAEFLIRLREAGLGSLPGTAAEILDDEVRAVLCPDKLDTARWLEVVETAHRAGFKTTATIMFGHIDRPRHWARHLLRIRQLQQRSGGFTEFVPLPFVHMEAPLYAKGAARRGPTWREVLLMHAVARLALHRLIPNIQASWVKLGADGVAACLRAGVNDLGGTLMNESISRAAGTVHGQEMPPAAMDRLILSLGRVPQQRTTLYAAASAERIGASYQAGELAPIVLSPAGKFARNAAVQSTQVLVARA